MGSLLDMALDLLLGKVCPACRKGRMQFNLVLKVYVCNNCKFQRVQG